MSKQRRTFSAEFKRDAAALVLDQGYSHLEASRSLGVVESVLRRWVRQLSQAREWGKTPKKEGKKNTKTQTLFPLSPSSPSSFFFPPPSPLSFFFLFFFSSPLFFFFPPPSPLLA